MKLAQRGFIRLHLHGFIDQPPLVKVLHCLSRGEWRLGSGPTKGLVLTAPGKLALAAETESLVATMTGIRNERASTGLAGDG